MGLVLRVVLLWLLFIGELQAGITSSYHGPASGIGDMSYKSQVPGYPSQPQPQVNLLQPRSDYKPMPQQPISEPHPRSMPEWPRPMPEWCWLEPMSERPRHMTWRCWPMLEQRSMPEPPMPEMPRPMPERRWPMLESMPEPPMPERPIPERPRPMLELQSMPEPPMPERPIPKRRMPERRWTMPEMPRPMPERRWPMLERRSLPERPMPERPVPPQPMPERRWPMRERITKSGTRLASEK
ncbi:uncharacterized protein LOC141772236 [Sebastes fasciatus]|uniref:uncharacterized protein LOC141772236 n=1 Tax=Sebastes fasciatus TaxID=394691 RepID=UPI003D9F528B